MGLLRAFKDATASTFADQWKEIIIAGDFDEHSLVVPGVIKTRNMGRGSNNMGSDGVISNGSKIFVPENTAAFIFNQQTIENIITEPGGYEYLDGDTSVFNGDGIVKPIASQIKKRFGYGGITPDSKRIAYVNLREIRNIRFGTPNAQVYHDPAYGIDIQVHAYGTYAIKVTDPERFITNFVPAGITAYSVDDPDTRQQLTAEFLQSFSVALNTLSAKYRYSQLPSLENEITRQIQCDAENAGTWVERFGFALTKATIAGLELSDESKALLRRYAEKKVDVSAYHDITQRESDIAAQQKIAEGIKDHGLGNAAGMVFGMNYAQNLGHHANSGSQTTVEQQLEILGKLKDALDNGILTQEEFEAKKREVLGL